MGRMARTDSALHHPHLAVRRTKIVATIGPASSAPAMLRRLVRAGLNIARVNFSHGDPRDHAALLARIRRAANAERASIAILADLCGPKVRVGRLAGGRVELREGTRVTVTVRPVLGGATLIPSQYRGLARDVRRGQRILLDDGALELRVLAVRGGEVAAEVVRGGWLADHKGMNLPDTRLRVAALTAKDRRDALVAAAGGADYLALSFVRRPEDIRALRRHLARHGVELPIIAKIEKPEALGSIPEIVELADGIMVARGDLGVELPPEQVPLIQDRLIQLANRGNKPVIVATQMLESMIEHPRPTRAEVGDVAGACLAGADAVMLSAETAAGRYPLEALAMMDTILRETESYQFFERGGRFKKAGGGPARGIADALGNAAAQLSRDLAVRCLLVPTHSGLSARFISADRPAAPIIALTPSEAVRRRLSLLWGVSAHRAPRDLGVAEALASGERLIRDRLGLAARGDHILMILNVGERAMGTNAIVVHRIS
jgi:pyruvate kinase